MFVLELPDTPNLQLILQKNYSTLKNALSLLKFYFFNPNVSAAIQSVSLVFHTFLRKGGPSLKQTGRNLGGVILKLSLRDWRTTTTMCLVLNLLSTFLLFLPHKFCRFSPVAGFVNHKWAERGRNFLRPVKTPQSFRP